MLIKQTMTDTLYLSLALYHQECVFCRDPQGALQGPFEESEMAEWFSAGYFTMNLLVKRGCDDVFLPLGELIKYWNCVPFMSTSSVQPAPLKVRRYKKKASQLWLMFNIVIKCDEHSFGYWIQCVFSSFLC